MMLYLVADLQSATGRQNHVTLVKMSQLVKTYREDKPNDSDDSSESHDSVVCTSIEEIFNGDRFAGVIIIFKNFLTFVRPYVDYATYIYHHFKFLQSAIWPE